VNKAFVFPANLTNGDSKSVAEASAHESGHTFSLYHQSVYDANGQLVNEYNPGDALRAPIMGRSYESQRGTWWSGPSITLTTIQRDLDVLGGNVFGFRDDDHSNVRPDATPLLPSGNTVSATGIIAKVGAPNVNDIDYFSFETQAGQVSFTLDVAPLGPMLDASLFLYDFNGIVITQAATASLGETLVATLAGGTYYLAVRGAGGYGDLGQYSLAGTIVAIPEPVIPACISAIGLLAVAGRGRRRNS
jgi:hypothetical protein